MFAYRIIKPINVYSVKLDKIAPLEYIFALAVAEGRAASSVRIGWRKPQLHLPKALRVN